MAGHTIGTSLNPDDLIGGTPEDDRLRGTSGDDTIHGLGGDDRIDGSGGNDVLYGEAGNDILNGRGGIDFLDGGVGADQMAGGTGGDTYHVDDAGDVVVEEIGGGDSDRVFSSVSWTMASNVEYLHLTGTADIDATGTSNSWQSIYGNSGSNVIRGLGGDDMIDAGAGDDELYGGSGDDQVQGGAGVDTVYGGTGDDSLAGDSFSLSDSDTAADTVDGGGGMDTLWASGGGDTLIGGTGDDFYLVNEHTDVTLVELAGEGHDHISLKNQSHTLGANFEGMYMEIADGGSYTGTGNASANDIYASGSEGLATVSLFGLGGDDTLAADGFANVTLNGGGGNDHLIAGSSSTILRGGDGHDRFWLGNADHTATGGAGSDVFVLHNALGDWGLATLTDFHGNQDSIEVATETLAGLEGEERAVRANEFVRGAEATTASHRFIFDSSAGALYYDSDGNGAAAQQLLANIDVVGGTFNHQDIDLVLF
jgi:serralysin